MKLFGDKKKEVDRLIQLFGPLDARHSEVIATLYAVWNDLIVSGSGPADQDIIDAFYNWGPSKKKYPKAILQKSLAWMRRKDLVPKGHGSHTVPSTRSVPSQHDSAI